VLTITFIVWSTNTIYSLLLLILIYFIGSILLLCWNIEYFAFLILIIYAGAITILFIFTVMMLNLKFKVRDTNWSVISVIVFGIGLIIVGLMFWWNDHGWYLKSNYELGLTNSLSLNKLILVDHQTLLQSLSNLIYTDYYLMLLIVGFVLLIGFIGAILITFELKSTKKINLNKVLTRTTFLKKMLK
jgi:NADH-quinone oxidoreductase subunit J